MRRWFTVLLLVMLPFQFAWTAAAAYCQHEDSPSARHIGHHEHQHKASSDGAKADASAQDAIKAVKLLGDNDCGYCHLGAAKLVRMQTPVIAVLTGPTALDTVLYPTRTRDPDRFERPKWRLA